MTVVFNNCKRIKLLATVEHRGLTSREYHEFFSSAALLNCGLTIESGPMEVRHVAMKTPPSSGDNRL